MTSPGAYPPTQVGQGNQNAIIAATPGESLAEALAAELRNLGWNAVVTDQVGPYAREARLCVAPLTPTTLNSPAIASALATPVAALIPLMVGATPLPPGPWATQPLVFSGDPAQTARDIVAVANTLGGASSTIPSMQPPASGPAYPSTGMTMPYAPAAPSQPLQPYQVAPGYPTQAGYGQYPQGYPQGGAPYAQPPAPPKRRRWPMVVGIIVGVVLLLCVVGGAFAYMYMGLNKFVGQVSTGVSQTETASAVTPTPEATATLAGTLYTDSAAGYSITYPNGWQKSASGDGVIFLDITSGAQLWLIPASGNIPQSDIKSTETQMFKSAGGSYTNVKGPTPVTYAGVPWEQESADTTSAGQSLHAVVLIANHGSHAYMIFYAASKSNFSSLDTQYFQPMLNSLSFQS